jgi:hypothetical protein
MNSKRTDLKKKPLEDIETNKWTQRQFQQVPKQNQGNYLKRKRLLNEIKKTVQDMKEDLNKDIEILKRKKKRIK